MINLFLLINFILSIDILYDDSYLYIYTDKDQYILSYEEIEQSTKQVAFLYLVLKEFDEEYILMVYKSKEQKDNKTVRDEREMARQRSRLFLKEHKMSTRHLDRKAAYNKPPTDLEPVDFYSYTNTNINLEPLKKLIKANIIFLMIRSKDHRKNRMAVNEYINSCLQYTPSVTTSVFRRMFDQYKEDSYNASLFNIRDLKSVYRKRLRAMSDEKRKRYKQAMIGLFGSQRIDETEDSTEKTVVKMSNLKSEIDGRGNKLLFYKRDSIDQSEDEQNIKGNPGEINNRSGGTTEILDGAVGGIEVKNSTNDNVTKVTVDDETTISNKEQSPHDNVERADIVEAPENVNTQPIVTKDDKLNETPADFDENVDLPLPITNETVKPDDNGILHVDAVNTPDDSTKNDQSTDENLREFNTQSGGNIEVSEGTAVNKTDDKKVEGIKNENLVVPSVIDLNTTDDRTYIAVTEQQEEATEGSNASEEVFLKNDYSLEVDDGGQKELSNFNKEMDELSEKLEKIVFFPNRKFIKEPIVNIFNRQIESTDSSIEEDTKISERLSTEELIPMDCPVENITAQTDEVAMSNERELVSEKFISAETGQSLQANDHDEPADDENKSSEEHSPHDSVQRAESVEALLNTDANVKSPLSTTDLTVEPDDISNPHVDVVNPSDDSNLPPKTDTNPPDSPPDGSTKNEPETDHNLSLPDSDPNTNSNITFYIITISCVVIILLIITFIIIYLARKRNKGIPENNIITTEHFISLYKT